MFQIKSSNGHVQYLITINYQRMMAFEQAAFITGKENLKTFYAAMADESEAYVKELCFALNVDETNLCNAQLCNDTIKNINAKKDAVSMLDFIISLEKTVRNWYKKAVADIKTFPAELAVILNRQQHGLEVSQSALLLL